MDTKTAPWQKRFELKTCAASDFAQAIPETALGVAVIYSKEKDGEKILLVIESRASGLLNQWDKRQESGKLPPIESLTISYHSEVLKKPTPETIHETCRLQMILATKIRRELRPSMR